MCLGRRDHGDGNKGYAWVQQRKVFFKRNANGTVTVTLHRCADAYTKELLRTLFFESEVHAFEPQDDGRAAFADASIRRLLEVLLPVLNMAYSRNASHTWSADLGAKDGYGKRYMWDFRNSLWRTQDADILAALKVARRAYRDVILVDGGEWAAWLAWSRALFKRIPFGERGGECWFRVSNCDTLRREGGLGAVLGLYALYMPSLKGVVKRVRAARVSSYTCREDRLAAITDAFNVLQRRLEEEGVDTAPAMEEQAPPPAGAQAAAPGPMRPSLVLLRQGARRRRHLSRAPCIGKQILRANFLHRDKQQSLGKPEALLRRMSISGHARCLELLLVSEYEEGPDGTFSCTCWSVLIPLSVGETIWTSFRFNTGQPVKVRIGGVVYTVRGCHCNAGIVLPAATGNSLPAMGDIVNATYTVYPMDRSEADWLAGVHLSGFFSYPVGSLHLRHCVNFLADVELAGEDDVDSVEEVDYDEGADDELTGDSEPLPVGQNVEEVEELDEVDF